MSKFIIGKKMEMTQRFKADGTRVPVTRVEVDPCTVIQVKTQKHDGYSAVQVGTGKKKHQTKPLLGHLKGLTARIMMEFRITEAEEAKFQRGDVLMISTFVPGDIVRVTGWSKGHGFQGVVKRHYFKGSPATRGHKDQLRMPGSTGAGGNQTVKPGKRMPGHMGDEKVTITNLEIIEVDEKNNSLFVKGALPGARNSMVYLLGIGDTQVSKPNAHPVQAEVKEVTPAPAAAETTGAKQ